MKFVFREGKLECSDGSIATHVGFVERLPKRRIKTSAPRAVSTPPGFKSKKPPATTAMGKSPTTTAVSSTSSSDTRTNLTTPQVSELKDHVYIAHTYHLEGVVSSLQ